MAKDTRFNDDAFRHHSFERDNLVGLPLGVKKIHTGDANQQEVTDRDDLMWLGSAFGRQSPFSGSQSTADAGAHDLEYTDPWPGCSGVSGASGASGASGVTGATGVQGVCPTGPKGPFPPTWPEPDYPPNDFCDFTGEVDACLCPNAAPPAPWPIGNPVLIVVGTYEEIVGQYAIGNDNECRCVGQCTAGAEINEIKSSQYETVSIQNDKKIWSAEIRATFCLTIYHAMIQLSEWLPAPNDYVPTAAEQAAWDAEAASTLAHENVHAQDAINIANEMTGRVFSGVGVANEGEEELDPNHNPFTDPDPPTLISGAALALSRAEFALFAFRVNLEAEFYDEIAARADAFHDSLPGMGGSAGLPWPPPEIP